MKRLALKTAAGILLFALLSTGCRRSGEPDLKDSDLRKWKGDKVEVQFRRDALGSAHQLPVSPTTSAINGARVSLMGVIVDIGPLGLVLKSGSSQYWIPRESILLVKFMQEG